MSLSRKLPRTEPANRFVPDLVITFTCTPSERPCVASNRFEMNCSSEITSWLTSGWRPPPSSLLTCWPSTLVWKNCWSPPPPRIGIGAFWFTDVVRLPGATSSSAIQLRPSAGSSENCFGSMLPAGLVCVTLTSGASAVTVTFSCSVAGCICTGMFAVCPASSVTCARTDWKPWSSMRIWYAPTRDCMRNTPRSSVTLVKVLPVASCTAVTVTPGSTPPDESVTTPVMTASVCANPDAGSARIVTSSAPKETHRRTNVMNPPLPNCQADRPEDRPLRPSPRRANVHAGPADGPGKLTYGWGRVNRKGCEDNQLVALVPDNPIRAGIGIRHPGFAGLMDRNRRQLEERVVGEQYSPGVK